MPRKKNSKAKPHPRTKGPPPHHVRQRFGPANNRDNSPFARPHGYTLAEEARNTASNRRGFRGRDARLRHQPVTFISAGLMDPLKDFEVPEQRDSPAQEKAAVLEALSPIELPAGSPSANSTAHRDPPQVQGEHPDDMSDGGSDSSDEVILFKGRNAGRQRQKSPSPTVESDTAVQSQVSSESRSVEDSVDFTFCSTSVTQTEELDFISLETGHEKISHSQHSRKFRQRRMTRVDEDDGDEEAAIIADYIANMQNDEDDSDDENDEDIGHPGLGSYSFNILRDLGGTDSDAIPSQPSSVDELGDEEDDEEDDDDEEDAEEQRELELEDEHLARLIAKQEELGLGGDDVLLLDGFGPDDGWIAASSMPRRKKKGASKKSRMFQGGSQFPSATRMAEAFDELDLMDIQNSRLQRSKKGPISFGLSDSELEDALNASIKKDRLKKADKKKAREELRSQGLLGKNANPHDLRVKYQGGMSLDDLAEEFESFMISAREQLILPPFDKSARKIVHTIANAFNIKSKSAGAGTGRYPVLYRSKTTLPFSEALFERTFSRVRRTWFPRVDVDESVVQQTRILKRTEVRPGKSRAGGRSALVLREGDVVGQNASEIGVENKGRAMLEKMGWTKGMSLGTMETKGIIVPLTHVIKKSKAGLGDI
ncbi:hypothetical protein F4802DRAFT_568653 [Xylaria palmicola]|nr:hypothetical protein F4802DRAFT_568653 [Xylaria palmicola]